jgi:hypothetical protein
VKYYHYTTLYFKIEETINFKKKKMQGIHLHQIFTARGFKKILPRE